MKKYTKVLVFALSLALLISATILPASAETRTAEVVLSTNNKPYTYQNEDGSPAGYDYEVLKLVDEYLTDWEFNYSIVDGDTATTGLETGKYDLQSACKFRTPAREEAYLISKPYNFFFLNLAVKADSGITSLYDLDGKSIAPILSTDGRTVTLLDWIAGHPEVQIEFEPLATSGTMAYEIAKVEDGVYDAAYLSEAQARAVIDEAGYTDLIITDIIDGRDTVFLYNKNNTELQAAMDEAIDALTADGTLGALTLEWFGQDNFAIAAELGLR